MLIDYADVMIMLFPWFLQSFPRFYRRSSLRLARRGGTVEHRPTNNFRPISIQKLIYFQSQSDARKA